MFDFDALDQLDAADEGPDVFPSTSLPRLSAHCHPRGVSASGVHLPSREETQQNISASDSHRTFSLPTDRACEVLASQNRIATAGGEWFRVLGICPQSSVNEVRRAFRHLALLHHPDKNLNGARDPTFMEVQKAYEMGMSIAVAASEEESHPWQPIPVTAPRRELRRATDHWESSQDIGESPTLPEEIQRIPVEEFARWQISGKCLAVDMRDPPDRGGPKAVQVPGAVLLSYVELLKTPERVTVQIRQLLEEHRPVVAFSIDESYSEGVSGTACALLVDVFGLDAHRAYALEGGYGAWQQ